MTQLSSFQTDLRAVVFGASGAIGSTFVKAFAGDERVASVYAGARTPQVFESTKVTSFQVDLTNDESVAEAATFISQTGPLDLVVIASGILHSGSELQPEKSLRDINALQMEASFRVNAIGPALICKHFLPHLRRDHKSALVALSARVGSISDNRLGGWMSYRSSKAALNMLIRTFAIEQRRSAPGSVLLALHPGTVDSKLSAPFQVNVPAEKLFSPEYSVNRLLEVINASSVDSSGGFFAWDGSRIEF